MADAKGIQQYAILAMAFLGFVAFVVTVLWPKIQDMKAKTGTA